MYTRLTCTVVSQVCRLRRYRSLTLIWVSPFVSSFLHATINNGNINLFPYKMSVALCTAKLQFLKQPQSAKVIYGQSVSLHVAASPVTPSIKYQWYLNGNPLVGQTSSHFTISSVVDSDVGDYVCVVVSGSDTRIQSEPAVIELTEISHQRRGVPAPAPQSQVFEPPKRYLITRGAPADREADVLLLEPRQPPVTKAGINAQDVCYLHYFTVSTFFGCVANI